MTRTAPRYQRGSREGHRGDQPRYWRRDDEDERRFSDSHPRCAESVDEDRADREAKGRDVERNSGQLGPAPGDPVGDGECSNLAEREAQRARPLNDGQTVERGLVMAPLAGNSRRGLQNPASLVVTNGRRPMAHPAPDLRDGERRHGDILPRDQRDGDGIHRKPALKPVIRAARRQRTGRSGRQSTAFGEPS
jgi:hypothetical protein